jgi:DNA-directed RNA polymerase specialized sigma24 family protein
MQLLKTNAETTSEQDRFCALYDANHDRVHRLLGRIAGPLDAEDLTQIVFTKAATALPRFRGDARVSTWLYRIAANVASAVTALLLLVAALAHFRATTPGSSPATGV